MNKKITQPTTTTLVLEVLRSVDDFMDYSALCAATGRTRDQVSAACCVLLRYTAVDRVTDVSGKLLYFALPKESDKRSYQIREYPVGTTKHRKAPKNRRRPQTLSEGV